LNVKLDSNEINDSFDLADLDPYAKLHLLVNVTSLDVCLMQLPALSTETLTTANCKLLTSSKWQILLQLELVKLPPQGQLLTTSTQPNAPFVPNKHLQCEESERVYGYGEEVKVETVEPFDFYDRR